MSDDGAVGAGIFIGLVIGFFIGTPVGCSMNERVNKLDAVKEGHAKWVMDPITGEVTWAWIKHQDPKEFKP